MIYHFTKSIIHLGLKGFFRNIEVLGRENIPQSGPVIYIANHPSALIDPLVVSILFFKRIHFLAGAEYFGKGFKSWLLKHEFNMIPVFRPNNYEGQAVDNSEMFSECYKCLDKNGSILIFPEGNSVTENKLRNLKTGVARILAGYKKTSSYKPVHIVPIGLNYEDAHKFHSDILVKFGEPIDYSAIQLAEESPETVKELTQLIESGLQNHMLHIEHYELDPLVSQINSIYHHQLDRRNVEVNTASRFMFQKSVINAIVYFQEKQPAVVKQVSNELEEYFSSLKSLNINPRELEIKAGENKFLAWSILTLLSPVFILGFVINAIPFLWIQHLYRTKYRPRINGEANLKPINPAFSATISFSIGTVTYLVWFIVISILIGLFSIWWIAIISFPILYILGLTTAWYRGIGLHTLRQRRNRKILKKNILKRDQLISQKKRILESLASYKSQYESTTLTNP